MSRLADIERRAQCAHCAEDALVGFGRDNVPLRRAHYRISLDGVRNIAQRLAGILTDDHELAERLGVDEIRAREDASDE